MLFNRKENMIQENYRCILNRTKMTYKNAIATQPVNGSRDKLEKYFEQKICSNTSNE